MKKCLLIFLSLTVSFHSFAVDNITGSSIQNNQPSIAVPVEDPDDQSYIVERGTGFDGVVEVLVGDGGGTGALLSTGRHILTAAHLWDEGNQNVDPFEVLIIFNLPEGEAFLSASSFTIHPDYDEDGFDTNNDIAIITLEAEAPASADRYEIYREDDEVGQVAIKCGYGLRGTGLTGQDDDDIGVALRKGKNRYDLLGETFNSFFGTEIIPGTQLFFDFDNGSADNDAAGTYFGINGLGLGIEEVNTTSGDSGGPSFIDNKIVGIVSYGITPFPFLLDEPNTDIDEETNSTFGEFSADTRVSFYADWIDLVAGTTPPTEINNFYIY